MGGFSRKIIYSTFIFYLRCHIAISYTCTDCIILSVSAQSKTSFLCLFYQLERHSSCSELCLDFALGQCSLEHTHLSPEIDKFHSLRKSVKEAVGKVTISQKKSTLSKTCQQVEANHRQYISHLIRTKHQGGYYRYILSNLHSGEIVVIIDYKMKVELGLRTRENQREWYGKRGISLHGFFVIAQV